MRASIGKNVLALMTLLMLTVIPGFLDGAQTEKTKAQKTPAAKDDPGPWMLAGRESECAPLSILSKKGPEYSDIQSPYQLAEKLDTSRK